MKALMVLVFSLALAGSAVAQHKHGSKGPNGGLMEDVAGVHAELLVSGTAVTINVLDEGSAPVKTAGFSGSVLVVAGSDRETIKLEPSGDASLKGTGTKPIAANAQITLILKTAGGKSGQARFTR